MNNEFVYNSNIIIWVAGIVLLLIGYGFYRIKKQHPGLKSGEVISSLAVDENEIIFICGIIGAGIGDAIIVASTHGANSVMMNPLGRIILHLSFFLVETVASITLVRDIASCFMKTAWRWRSWKIVTTILIGIAVFMIPFWTLSIAASNLGADFEWDMWKYSLSANATEWSNAIQYYKLEANGVPYRAFDHVPVPLKLLLFSAGVRFLLLAIEGSRNVGSPARSRILFERLEQEMADENERMAKKKEEKKDEKKDEGKAEDKDQLKSNIKYCLNRLGYDGPKLDQFIGLATKALDSIKEDSIKAGMSARMAQFVTRGSKIKVMEGTAKAKANEELKKDIRDFFSGPVSPTRPTNMSDADYVKIKGLGLSIKEGGKS